MPLTFCDTILSITVKTRPAVAAVPLVVIATVCKSRALVPVVGACLRIVDKHCKNKQCIDSTTQDRHQMFSPIFKQQMFKVFVVYRSRQDLHLHLLQQSEVGGAGSKVALVGLIQGWCTGVGLGWILGTLVHLERSEAQRFQGSCFLVLRTHKQGM